MRPDEETICFYNKDELLHNLIDCEHLLLTQKFDVNSKEQQMRLCLVRYFMNMHKSNKVIWDRRGAYVDFSTVTVISNIEENWQGRDVTLKSILVQACDYDSIEGQLYRTITTSKFNIYETFYDFILHDYRIFQIPKKVYDENLQQYVDRKQSEFLVSDKERRLKDELEAICKSVPLEEREQYCRSRIKIKRYDLVD